MRRMLKAMGDAGFSNAKRLLNSSLFPPVVATVALLGLGFFSLSEERQTLRGNIDHSIEELSMRLGGSLLARLESTVNSLAGIALTLSLDATPDEATIRTIATSALGPKAILSAIYVRQDGAPVISFGKVPDIVPPPREAFTPIGAFLATNVNAGATVLASKTMVDGKGKTGFFLLYTMKFGIPGSKGWRGDIVGYVEKDRLLQSALWPATNSALPLDYALRDERSGLLLYGDAATFDKQPRLLSWSGSMPGWSLAIVPEKGWDQAPSTERRRLLELLIATVFVAGLTYYAAHLLKLRRKSREDLRRQDETLRNMSYRLGLAMEAAKIGIWEYDMNTQRVTVDDNLRTLFNIDLDDPRPVEDLLKKYIQPGTWDEMDRCFQVCVETGARYDYAYSIVMDDGSRRHIHSVGSIVQGDPDHPTIIGLSQDVTTEVQAAEDLRLARRLAEEKAVALEQALNDLSDREQSLAAMTERLNLALSAFDCGIWQTFPDQNLTIWDERMYALFGQSPSEEPLTWDAWLKTVHPDDREAQLQRALQPVDFGARTNADIRLLLPDGQIRHLRSVAIKSRDRSGATVFTGLTYDVTGDVLMSEQLRLARDEAEQRAREIHKVHGELLHNARHDILTGLSNRLHLEERLTLQEALPRRGSDLVVALHLGVDRLKPINDTLGYAAGDAMLIHTAMVLSELVGPEDLVGRTGNDEFVILLGNNRSDREVRELALRIIEQMKEPVRYQGHDCRIGVTVGIAENRTGRKNGRQLLTNADIAYHRAKERGRGRYEFFTADLASHLTAVKGIADEILRGIENDEFEPWYQPQFDAVTRQLVGAEALVRWNHPTRGVLAPFHFLKVAEDLNVLSALDCVVLKKSLRDRRIWQEQGLAVPKVSVNVSARRLQDTQMLDTLRQLNIVPGELSFELVESIFLDETDSSMERNIQEISKLGIDIEIDDFGTGYTSIVSLLRLKPKRLKIDRELVMPILGSDKSVSVVRSIIDIGRTLDIDIVAEGVESMEHAAMLQALGCDSLQGYAFSKPLPLDAFIEFGLGQRWQKAG